jgi:hypothetical protein
MVLAVFSEVAGSPFDFGHNAFQILLSDVNETADSTRSPRQERAFGSCLATARETSRRLQARPFKPVEEFGDSQSQDMNG